MQGRRAWGGRWKSFISSDDWSTTRKGRQAVWGKKGCSTAWESLTSPASSSTLPPCTPHCSHPNSAFLWMHHIPSHLWLLYTLIPLSGIPVTHMWTWPTPNVFHDSVSVSLRMSPLELPNAHPCPVQSQYILPTTLPLHPLSYYMTIITVLLQLPLQWAFLPIP